MNITQLLADLHRQTQVRGYIRRLEILARSASVLKARLYISSDLFVQVYRNDQFDTTNLVLIYNSQRLYGRDQLAGQWHRHPADAPHVHDHSTEGKQPIALSEFLDEIEVVLSSMNLP